MDSLDCRLIRLDSIYNDKREVNKFIHTKLKENCNQYHEVDSLKRLYSSYTFESIASPQDCRIMRNGTFRIYGETDSTRIKMSKKEQIIEYPDGTYTKSKIKWLNDCSYKVIRKESNNASDSMVKPGHEMTVKIIYVMDNCIVFYEILLNNKAYSGRMIKILE